MYATIDPPHVYNGGRVSGNFVRTDRNFRNQFTGQDAASLRDAAKHYFKHSHTFAPDELDAYCRSVQDGVELVSAAGQDA